MGDFRPWAGRPALIVTRVSLMALIGAALPILVAQGVAWMTVPSAEHPPQ